MRNSKSTVIGGERPLLDVRSVLGLQIIAARRIVTGLCRVWRQHRSPQGFPKRRLFRSQVLTNCVKVIIVSLHNPLLKRLAKTVLFSALALFGALIVCEVLLHLASFTSPRAKLLLAPPWDQEAAVAIPDSRLGHRPNPALAEHDQFGFRNGAYLDVAEIVALGDSQTYGHGVPPSQAWPQQLAKQLDLPVYNMGFGGFGPLHCLRLWDEAVKKRPSLIIFAFYAGNDLYDSYSLAYQRSVDREEIQQLLRPELLETSAEDPFRELVIDAKPSGVRTFNSAPKALLSDHSAVYGLLRRIRHFAQQQARNAGTDQAWKRSLSYAAKFVPEHDIFEADGFRTIFRPRYRFQALNLDDARIQAGYDIAMFSILAMAEKARNENCEFLVLFLPTKEFVFRSRNARPSIEYQLLIKAEQEMWKRTAQVLTEESVPHLDLAQALERMLDRGTSPYPIDHDGHFNEVGYAIVAQEVAAYVQTTRKLTADTE